MTSALTTYPSNIDPDRSIALTEHFIPAGTCFPLHWHDFIEFEIILSGSATHIYNNSTYTVSPGSAYMMYYYDYHSLTALTDVTLYSIHFEKDLLAPELLQYMEYHKCHCQFDPLEQAHMVSLLQQLQQEFHNLLPFKNILIKNILTEIIIAALRKTAPVKDTSVPLPLQQAVAYINAHFREALTLQQLAEHMSFTPNYLGQLLKNQTGRTFHEYLNTLRLKYACSLLTASELSVKEIAFAAGYRSVQYFLSVFKARLCMTPNEYRRQYRHN